MVKLYVVIEYYTINPDTRLELPVVKSSPINRLQDTNLFVGAILEPYCCQLYNLKQEATRINFEEGRIYRIKPYLESSTKNCFRAFNKLYDHFQSIDMEMDRCSKIAKKSVLQ